MSSNVVILESAAHLEQLFVEATRIGLEQEDDDPDRKWSIGQVITWIENIHGPRFDLGTLQMLLISEGLSAGNTADCQAMSGLVAALREARLVDIQPSHTLVLPRGLVLIAKHY